MEKVYIIKITTTESDYGRIEVTNQVIKAFTTKDKASDYLRKEFHELCVKYDIQEIGKYEHVYKDGSFHLQEDPENSSTFGDWEIDGYLYEVELD